MILISTQKWAIEFEKKDILVLFQPDSVSWVFHGSFAQEESILDAFVRTSQSIYETEGVAGFFQGGAARAVQIGMESCVFFTILEALKDGAKLILDF